MQPPIVQLLAHLMPPGRRVLIAALLAGGVVASSGTAQHADRVRGIAMVLAVAEPDRVARCRREARTSQLGVTARVSMASAWGLASERNGLVLGEL
jgi:hypothetical protein